MDTPSIANGSPMAASPPRDPMMLILDRLERIEARLDRWEAAAAPVPAAVGAATDMFDEVARRAADGGAGLDERLRSATELLDHASRPETLDTLTRLLDRIEDAEASLTLLASAPKAAATVVDIVDRTLRDWQDMGYSVDARLTALRDLALEATRPEVVNAARQLAEHLPTIAKVVPDAEQLPGYVAIGVDVFDRWAATLAEGGSSIEQVLRNTVLALSRLGRLLESREFAAVMDSGVLDPAAVQMVGRAGGALAVATTDGADRVGLFALMRELKDPGVRNGIAFGLNVLRAFGSELPNRTLEDSNAGA